MKVMIKTELERAFKSWSLWLSLIIGMGLSIAQIITRIIPAAMNPLMGYMPDNATLMPISAFQVWIGNGVSFEYSLFIRLILFFLFLLFVDTGGYAVCSYISVRY